MLWLKEGLINANPYKLFPYYKKIFPTFLRVDHAVSIVPNVYLIQILL